MWTPVLKSQRDNVDACLATLKTQLPSKRSKLTKLDIKCISEFVDSIDDSVGIKRKAFMYDLCHEFMKISRKMDYLDMGVNDISSIVSFAFSCEINCIKNEMSPSILETLYYITGWTISACRKVAEQRREEVATALRYLANSCTITSSVAKPKNLPTGKIDRIMAFGALSYASQEYFEFILRIEEVYVRLLTNENLIVHGSFLIHKIKTNLLNNSDVKWVFNKFMMPNSKKEIRNVSLDYLLGIYARMRGKDFCFKLLSKGSVLKVSTRQAMAVLADPKHRIKT